MDAPESSSRWVVGEAIKDGIGVGLIADQIKPVHYGEPGDYED
jgi:hypothetical protein